MDLIRGLPDAVVDILGGYLDCPSLLVACNISQDWRDKFSRFCRVLRFSTEDYTEDVLQNRFSILQTVICQCADLADRWASMEQKVLESTSAISLSLRYLFILLAAVPFSCCATVEQLELSVHAESLTGLLWQAVERFINLKSLRLTNVLVVSSPSILPTTRSTLSSSLLHLSISGLLMLYSATSAVPGLTTLWPTLAACGQWSRLRSLDLFADDAELVGAPDDDAKTVLSQLNTLTWISIVNCPEFVGFFVDQLEKHRESLNYLDLSNAALKPAGLKQLHQLKNLQKLHLGKLSDEVTMALLKELLEELPQLSSISWTMTSEDEKIVKNWCKQRHINVWNSTKSE